MFVIGAAVFSLPALGDTGGSVSASLVTIGSPEVAGGGGAADCEPLCPPPIPALYATKRWDLVGDHFQIGFFYGLPITRLHQEPSEESSKIERFACFEFLERR